RFYWNNYVNREDLLKSIQYFEAAIAKDSNYALAHAGLSDSYLTLSTDWQTPRESVPKAQEHALKALELDESLGEAHFSRGAIAYFYEWDWATAKKELERAFELNAKTLEGNSCYLHSLDSSGNPDGALIHVRRALDQNPLSISISGELGCASYYARRYDQAIDFSRETLRMEQGYVFARYNAARALGQKQMHEQAIAELKKAMELVESRFDIRLDRELGFDHVSLHLDLRASRSITSKAGSEEDGFWRYRRKRSSASCR
ncbi:MAG: tetratricopeptide repeat protein, partial [Pyrinomonadaceae bacterium]